MSDLQCPMRVHLGDDAHGDRVVRVVDGSGRSAEGLAEELVDLADEFRGEAVQVLLDDAARAAVVRLLTGRGADASMLEGDSEGWRVVSTERPGEVRQA